MGREYSFESYAPGENGDAGHRLDYGDHFSTVKDATAAMLESLFSAPEGSVAVVYQRSPDGDRLLPHRNWRKDGGSVTREKNFA
jgi:hypothetical protein